MDPQSSFDLHLENTWNSFKRSWLLAAGAFAACVALAAFYSTRLTPVYEADAKLLFIPDRTSALTGFGGDDTGQLESLLIDQTPLSTQMEIIKSRPLMQETIDLLNLQDPEGEPLGPDDLAQEIEINLIGGTDILDIKYQHTDPETAAAVVNTLIQVYREYSITVNRDEAKEARRFITDQLPRTEENVRQADMALRNFLEQNNIINLDEEARSAVSFLENLDNQMTTVRADLEAASARSNAIQNQIDLGPEAALTVSALNQSVAVQEAFKELKEVERELANQRARYSPSSPVVRQLSAKQASLQDLVRQEVFNVAGTSTMPDGLLQSDPVEQSLIETLVTTEAEAASLREQLRFLQLYREEFRRRVDALPKLKQEQLELERQVEAARATYDILLTRLQELQVQENETVNNTRVVNPASVPTEPSSGAQLKILVLGAMGGIMVAIAIVIAFQVLGASTQEQVVLKSDDDADSSVVSPAQTSRAESK